jgi:ribonuclease BN (tRNA processing enzyme)
MIIPTRLSRESLEAKLSTLPNKTYNKFMWWRRYQSRQTKPDKSTFYDKIVNGDFETSDYYYQAEYENYLLEDAVKDIKHYEDKVSHISMFRARHKRLMEDYEKEEAEILRKLKLEFKKVFKISKDDLERIMETFDGTTLDLYIYIKDLVKQNNPPS